MKISDMEISDLGISDMKISRDTGRKENLAACICWIMLMVLYYSAGSFLIRGYIIPAGSGVMGRILPDSGTIALIIISVILTLLTVRLLFREYLRWRAYRVQKGPGWQAWRAKREEQDLVNREGDDLS